MPEPTEQNDKDTIRAEFDGVAPVYESNRLAPWYKAHAREILNELADKQRGDVLDIGCATGYMLREHVLTYPKSKGLGIDISANMVKVAQDYARQAHIENLDFISADWETMNTDNIELANLDTIVCANTFHYFADPQAATNKMAGLLNKGDMLYILERDKSNSLLTLFWDILHRTIIKDHVVFYDRKMLRDILRKAGFENIHVRKHLKRYFWKGKLFTNIILISCQKS